MFKSKYNTYLENIINKYDKNTITNVYKIKDNIYDYFSQFMGIYYLDFIPDKNKIIMIVSLTNKELYISSSFEYELTVDCIKLLSGTFEIAEIKLLFNWLMEK